MKAFLSIFFTTIILILDEEDYYDFNDHPRRTGRQKGGSKSEWETAGTKAATSKIKKNLARTKPMSVKTFNQVMSGRIALDRLDMPQRWALYK